MDFCKVVNIHKLFLGLLFLNCINSPQFKDVDF